MERKKFDGAVELTQDKAGKLEIDASKDPKESVAAFMREMTEAVNKALREAEMREIKSNAVIINEDLDFSKAFACGYDICGSRIVRRYPPMIFGKHVFTAKLPKGYSFCLTQVDDEKTMSENEKLRKKVESLERKLQETKDRLQEILGEQE